MTAPDTPVVTKVDIVSVTDTTLNGTPIPIWYIEQNHTLTDGTVVPWIHILPKEAAEMRAAELAIDPTDTATILDINLLDPFYGEDIGQICREAATPAEARQKVLDLTTQAKLRVRLSSRGPETKQIRDRACDPKLLAQKRSLAQDHPRQKAAHKTNQ